MYCRNLRSYSSVLLCIGLLLPGISIAQEIDQFLPKVSDSCLGDLEKRHQNEPPWDFTTNSRLPTPKEPTAYLHCVFNNDPRNVLDVDWLIPRLKQTIPARSSALSPRYSDGPPLGRPDGCLVFGNLHNKSLKAQFWARPEDDERVKEESGKDCLVLKSASTRPVPSKAERRPDSIAPFRVFLRSRPEITESALVALEGITGLRMKGTGAYQSFVTYRLRDGAGQPPFDMERYTIVPRLSGPAEAIAKLFLSIHKGPIALRPEKEPVTVSFVVDGSPDWNLQELEYVVQDSRGTIAASFFSPVFSPSTPR